MQVSVNFVQGKEFKVCMRGHEVRVDVPPDRRFIGYDGYKQAMDSLRKGEP